MTMRELDRLKCIQGLIDGELKQYVAATRQANRPSISWLDSDNGVA
jgi:hypothetical protein